MNLNELENKIKQTLVQHVRFTKVKPNAITPTKGTEGAACFDLAATETVIVPAGCSKVVGTGIAVALPPNTVLKVYSRSGLGFKYNVRLSNGTGIIDSDYRGEIKLSMFNDSDDPYSITEGDRIAQCMVLPVLPINWIEEDSLDDTQRGAGGMGSTGA